MQLSAEFLKVEPERVKEVKSKIDSQHDVLSKLEDTGDWYVGIQIRAELASWEIAISEL